MNVPASAHWFLFSDYVPPDRTKFLSVWSIARAISMNRRRGTTRFAQHSRIGRWLCKRSLEKKYQPN